MSHCHDEHKECDHDHTKPGDGDGDSLFSHIDTSKVRCLNIETPEDAPVVFKPHVDRLDKSRFVISNDGDPEMIYFIPFTSAVRIKSFSLSGGTDGKHPSSVKLFVNREDIDFSNAESAKPDQVIELAEDPEVRIDYPVKQTKFGSVHGLTMFFDASFGGDEAVIFYIGFKGVDTKVRRGIVEAVYESRAQLSDHKAPATTGGRMGI